MSKTYCIIGAGTYGCYLANVLSEKFPDDLIYMFEVGNSRTKSEKEIGYFSKLTSSIYKAASDGRYFGFGGTSARWGGQLLFFDDLDFKDCREMEKVVEINKKYKQTVINRFFKNSPSINDEKLNQNLFVKKGIWLKFQHRNMFSHFQIEKKKNVKIIKDKRVVRLNVSNNRIDSVIYQDDNIEKEFKADIFYLTAGALEALRLLATSNVVSIEQSSFGFSDHISLRCFEIKSNSAKVGPVDFQFRFNQGSMLTSRLAGEIGDVSFYAHPIFNESFLLFQILKQMIFKRQFSFGKLLEATKQVGAFFPFVYSYLVKKKLFIYKSWHLNIDIEVSESKNFIQFTDQEDDFGQKGIQIKFEITKATIEKLLTAKETVKEFLEENKIDYVDLHADASSLKLEDVYHPYSLFRYKENENINKICNPISNLFMYNTGVLKRAGAINPTASVFCLIEDHIKDAQ